MIGSKQRAIFSFLLAVLLLLSSCYPVKKYYLKPISSSEAEHLAFKLNPKSQGLKSWNDISFAVKRSLEYVSKKPPSQKVFSKYIDLTWEDIKNTLEEFLKILPKLDKKPELLAEKFKWYELIPSPLFTGYYEPLIKASLKPRPDYPYPIYGLPKDLKKADLGEFHPRWKGQTLVYRIENGEIKPYYTREEIEKYKVIDNKAPKIAWAKNLIDIYFLQVQGSGRLLLPNGSIIHIGYAGKNGRPFVSIGKLLVKAGFMQPEEINIENIKKFFKDHPKLMKKILYQDPSYVFFRLLPDGPIGAMGQKLTPYISLATDPSILPLGSMIIFFLDLPKGLKDRPSSIKGIGLSQDIGGAIKGHRIDLFCGFGDRAEIVASSLKRKGRVFLLLKK